MHIIPLRLFFALVKCYLLGWHLTRGVLDVLLWIPRLWPQLFCTRQGKVLSLQVVWYSRVNFLRLIIKKKKNFIRKGKASCMHSKQIIIKNVSSHPHMSNIPFQRKVWKFNEKEYKKLCFLWVSASDRASTSCQMAGAVHSLWSCQLQSYSQTLKVISILTCGNSIPSGDIVWTQW